MPKESKYDCPAFSAHPFQSQHKILFLFSPAGQFKIFVIFQQPKYFHTERFLVIQKLEIIWFKEKIQMDQLYAILNVD